jgi:predicted dehydrogenase
MLKVAIVGCGKIADAHAAQIQRLSGARIVGVCDREPLMARQLWERFPVDAFFSDVEEMIRKAQPDVVHITTPPTSHYPVARLLLENGCHVYVEKPFTVTAEEAYELVELAKASRRKLTVGHNEQFSHVARQLRALASNGYLGDTPVHMESHFGYDLGDPAYARALLDDRQHWARNLPGNLLQNIISHGIARIAEFLQSESPTVVAVGFSSPFLKRLGENELVDELRVIITEECGTTAYFTFSSQMRPLIHEFRIFGSKNGLLLDQDHDILLKLRGKKYKSYADKFIPPLEFARQHIAAARTNLRLFLKRDFHPDAGMKNLIEEFYKCIENDTPAPIPYPEILRTANIMDAIFDQLREPAAANVAEFRHAELAVSRQE